MNKVSCLPPMAAATVRASPFAWSCAVLTESVLNSYLGRSIAQICPHGYDGAQDNHCAHFVAHVLQLDFGMTCGRLRRRPGGANVRVQELFAQCPSSREVVECPSTGQGLIFVSDRRNFSGTPTQIENVRRKHVGVMSNGRVWHYSNTLRRVVVQTVGEFLSHYPRQDNALWYGALPAACRAASFGTCA